MANFVRKPSIVVIGVFIYLVASAAASLILHSANTPVTVVTHPTPITTQQVLEKTYRLSFPQSSILAHTIDTASKVERVDSMLLMAMINRESEFRPRRGADGEVGYLQTIPKIWDGLVPYNLHDRYENVFAGAWIIRHYQIDLGNERDALAAYNIGIGNFKRGKLLSRGYEYADDILKNRDKLRGTYHVSINTVAAN